MIYKARKGQTSYGEAIGIILMESFMPFPPGCPGNATTFSFPVRYANVKGANMEKLVYQGDPELLKPFIDAGWDLVNEGVKAVTGNCGFMVLYHDIMAKEFPVPVFMSSLLQLPFISRMLKPGEKIGIITASSKTLTEKHLQIATNGADIPLAIAGMEDQKHFYDAIHAEVGELDFDAVEAEVVGVTQDLIAREENIKAILFECTDLPPYAAATQQAVGLPVFDFTTMINYVYSGLVRKRFEGFC
ncbi:MAG: aspartate/glutamate racemase family protein [Desulfobacterales bacterium]|jgi:aspartate/glutamate racemase